MHILPRFLPGFLACAMLACVPALSTAQEVAGTVKSLRGEASLERAGVRRPARLGESLYEKDRLRTGDDGYASVAFRDQSSLAIGPRADVDLSRYQFRATTQQGEQQVRVRSGSLAAISGKIAKAGPDAVQFNAGTVTLGVRGTQFVIDTLAQAEGAGPGHWTDSRGQPLRSTWGLCWQAGQPGPATHSACNPNRFVLLPDRDGRVGRIDLSVPGQVLTLQAAYASAEAGPADLQAVALSQDEVRRRYQGLLDALPPAPRQFVVRFASGSASQLNAESLPVLEQARAAIAGWPVVPNISVVGHTDTVGDLTSNDALSLERARVVARMLQSGRVEPDHVHADGRGEREPLRPTQDDTPEAVNRRVEITVY